MYEIVEQIKPDLLSITLCPRKIRETFIINQKFHIGYYKIIIIKGGQLQVRNSVETSQTVILGD